MAETYTPGQSLQRGDLEIKFQDSEGPVNVYSITYAIYYVDPSTQLEILIGNAVRHPINPQRGEYYAALMVPPSANLGDYRIRWTIVDSAGSSPRTVVMQFTIVEKNANIITYSTERTKLIRRLRILLRDQNPDKFYHFRPPEHEGRINKYDRVFGQIWEDEELNEYLEAALHWWNSLPPMTNELCTIEQLISYRPAWLQGLIWMAIVHAMFAISANWIADEFDYSIGGISLSLEKSSKYEGLKNNAESWTTKYAESKARTYKITAGLRQSRYGRGIRSAFGPYTGRSVLSPRNFL